VPLEELSNMLQEGFSEQELESLLSKMPIESLQHFLSDPLGVFSEQMANLSLEQQTLINNTINQYISGYQPDTLIGYYEYDDMQWPNEPGTDSVGIIYGAVIGPYAIAVYSETNVNSGAYVEGIVYMLLNDKIHFSANGYYASGNWQEYCTKKIGK
jgi:hypothetical protein